MADEGVLAVFYKRIEDDPCIDAKHISLFVALYNAWKEKGALNPVCCYSTRIMPVAKISSTATYFNKLKYLIDGGYIKYEPSYDAKEGSKVWMVVE